VAEAERLALTKSNRADNDSSARTGFDSLRAIHAEDPQLLNDLEIYVDGGCRRGSEVVQAIALGARGVGLGRPFLWAQAAYGEKGVIRAVRSEWESQEPDLDTVFLADQSAQSWKAR
jgi:isopentenyl diphosphate isomerase/L-lactate dehydrogenase-like FMN-dependent dehydrogenase